MSRVGIVGAGYWGLKHLRVFHELRECDLIMVCDQDPEKLDHVKHYYPMVQVTENYQELLESNVDAIIVATPVNTHYDLTSAALKAGKHVLAEKPLTADTKTAQALVTLADKQGLVMMAGHTYQYHPAVEFLKEYLASGDLGSLYYIDSARLNLGVFRNDVDVLWDLAPHDISILLYLLEQDPLWISAKATAHINPSLVEVSYLSMGFANQVLAHTHVSWLDPCKVRRLTLVGSKKMVVFDELAPPEDQIRIYDKGASLNQNGSSSDEAHVQYRYGDITAPFIPYAEPLKQECIHFLECVENGTVPRSNGREALRVISILEAAHQSLESGEQTIYLQNFPPAKLADPVHGETPLVEIR